jgi:hypothetical protein
MLQVVIERRETLLRNDILKERRGDWKLVSGLISVAEARATLAAEAAKLDCKHWTIRKQGTDDLQVESLWNQVNHQKMRIEYRIRAALS